MMKRIAKNFRNRMLKEEQLKQEGIESMNKAIKIGKDIVSVAQVY